MYPVGPASTRISTDQCDHAQKPPRSPLRGPWCKQPPHKRYFCDSPTLITSFRPIATFRGTDNILRKIPHIQLYEISVTSNLNVTNISQNTVSPT